MPVRSRSSRSGRPSPAGELGGADEFQVLVRAARQNARDVLGADDRHRERPRGAVQGRDDDIAAGPHQRGERARARPRDRARARASPCRSTARMPRAARAASSSAAMARYSTATPVSSACSSATSSTARDEIDAEHPRTAARHRLGEDAAAAADVEDVPCRRAATARSMYSSRSGLRSCSGFDGPFGSHQLCASDAELGELRRIGIGVRDVMRGV